MALTSLQQQRRRFHWFSWSGAALVGGILVVLNVIASFLPIRLDTSEGRVYSISHGTREILKKLDDTLLIKVVFSADLPPEFKLNEQYVSDLVSEYRRASHHVRVEYLNPGVSPEARMEAIQLGVSPVNLNVIQRDRHEVSERFMGVALSYGDKREAVPIIQDTDGLEYEITSRIKKLVAPERVSIGLVSTGDALTLSSKGMETVQRPLSELYDVQNVDAAQPISPSLKSLWLISPAKALDPMAQQNLAAYVQGGGTLGLILNSYDITISEFRVKPLGIDWNGLLSNWGLRMGDGLVVDPHCDRIQIRAVQGAYQMINVVDYPYFPWVTDMDRGHPAMKGIDGFAMPFVSPIETLPAQAGVTTRLLARSSEDSFIDSHPEFVNPLQQTFPQPGARRGPFGLIAVSEIAAASKGAKPGRVILFGGASFLRSEFPLRQENLAVFINMVDWSSQDENLVQIRSKGFARRPVRMMSDGARALYKFLMAFVLPLSVIGTGLFVWRRERYRRALLPLVYREN